MLLHNRSCVARAAPAAGSHHARSSAVARPLTQQRVVLCKAGEQRSRTEQDNQPIASTSQDDDVLSRSEVQKLSELKREQQRGQSQTNLLQGALEEAQLITWPTPQKAFFDTLLVLGIVTASGAVLLGLNVVLAEASEWWYHR